MIRSDHLMSRDFGSRIFARAQKVPSAGQESCRAMTSPGRGANRKVGFDSLSSIHFALTQDLPVSLARVFVILRCLLHLVGFDEALFLRPALIDSFQTPLGAAFRGAHRFVSDLHPNRVRVRRWQDARSHPTAPFDL